MHEIVVTVEGGVVRSVEHIPPGIAVTVMDFDVDGVDPADLHRNERGEPYVRCRFEAENEPDRPTASRTGLPGEG